MVQFNCTKQNKKEPNYRAKQTQEPGGSVQICSVKVQCRVSCAVRSYVNSAQPAILRSICLQLQLLGKNGPGHWHSQTLFIQSFTCVFESNHGADLHGRFRGFRSAKGQLGKNSRASHLGTFTKMSES